MSYTPNRQNMDFTSRRSPVVSKHGMVATSQPLAVAAGAYAFDRPRTPVAENG